MKNFKFWGGAIGTIVVGAVTILSMILEGKQSEAETEMNNERIADLVAEKLTAKLASENVEEETK